MHVQQKNYSVVVQQYSGGHTDLAIPEGPRALGAHQWHQIFFT